MKVRSALRRLLWPLSLLYREVVRIRVWMYARGILRQYRLTAPVISVGNLTVGGTGKTPMVIWLAERFLAQGYRVGILTRGYKGRNGSSDEIELMKDRLQNRVEFGVGANRYEQGLRLREKGVDLFLLDDGFQHLALARDVNILLLDASQPLSNEPLLPSGCLREPLSEMGRADLLVFTRAETSARSREAIAKFQEDFPVFSASTRLLGFYPLDDREKLLSSQEIGSGPFFAFSAIGNPKSFVEDLKQWTIPVVGSKAYRDHHRYTSGDLEQITAEAQTSGARALLTTEKDAQNLADVKSTDFPVYVAVIEFEIAREDVFLSAIQRRLDARQSIV